NGVLYQFWVKDVSTNKWKMIQDYSKSSARWTPTKPGKYLYGVHIKDEKSNQSLDAHLYKEITVKGSLFGKTIMLDPGHGGSDPGAVNGSIYEKNLNNSLTKLIAQKLTSLGANVIYTRNPDSNIRMELDQRAAIANQKMPDLFISIHHDASYVKGYSMHYSSYRPYLEVSGAYFKDSKGKTHYIIREVNRRAYYIENGVEKYITIDNTAPATIYDSTPSSAAKNSKIFANLLLDSMKELKFISPRNNPVSDHNLAITRWTNMPSVLIEAGPTNSTLANKSNQNAIADKMVDAIKKYFN
ncbi:hypothetical protein GC105_16675, partial [Alkalibaculum sp. M08DMB]